MLRLFAREFAMPTILITGCSSGFGLETARLFLECGWHVVATMRRPQPELLPASDRLRVLPLDVADPASIERALADAGPIDALVNNAGIGWLNALEGTSMETVRRVFETNLFGTIDLTRAVAPAFREARAGAIVNVSSSTTLAPMPFLAVYSASKAAVNMFTEALAEELSPFGVRVRLVIPGRAPGTAFSATGQAASAREGGFPPAYADLVKSLFARYTAQANDEVTHASDVAEAIWRAVTDPAAPVRIPAGADAVALSRATS